MTKSTDLMDFLIRGTDCDSLDKSDEAWKEANSLQNSNRSSRSQSVDNHLRLFDRARDSRKNSAVSDYGFKVSRLFYQYQLSTANNWTLWKFPRSIFQFSLNYTKLDRLKNCRFIYVQNENSLEAATNQNYFSYCNSNFLTGEIKFFGTVQQ